MRDTRSPTLGGPRFHHGNGGQLSRFDPSASNLRLAQRHYSGKNAAKGRLMGGTRMFLKNLARFAVGAFAAAALAFTPNAATAQTGNPITIGFAMSLTGPLAANGKQALLGMQIWEEEINAKGGLLGRPVKLVYYDDQTNPSTIPGIYTKLLDVDKVDLVVGPYATNMAAPAMPVVMQRNKLSIGILGLAVNSEFHYPKYFVMIP